MRNEYENGNEERERERARERGTSTGTSTSTGTGNEYGNEQEHEYEHEYEQEHEHGNRVTFLGVFAVVGSVVLVGGVAPSPPTPLPRWGRGGPLFGLTHK